MCILLTKFYINMKLTTIPSISFKIDIKLTTIPSIIVIPNIFKKCYN